MARSFDKATSNEQEAAYARIMTPAIKYWSCKLAPALIYECMECLGGNGVTEDFIMARLYREAPINAIWEGSGNVQALDMLRALAKTPAVLDVWFAELAKTTGSDPRLDKAVTSLKREFADMDEAEYRARDIVDRLSLTMQASQLVAAGNSAVADAFIASRLGEHGDRNYGTLPRGLDLDEILARANPWEGS